MKQKFKEWWNRPIKPLDRFFAALVGAFAGFWLLPIGRLFLVSAPVSFSALAYWAVTGTLLGIISGIAFPRLTGVLLYPFMFIGFGGD